MKDKKIFLISSVIAIGFFLFINKVLVPQEVDSQDEITDEAIQDEEITEDTFVVDKYMCVEEENGLFVTSAVCVHNGKSYVLNEAEYIYLKDGGQMEEVLKKRKEKNE